MLHYELGATCSKNAGEVTLVDSRAPIVLTSYKEKKVPLVDSETSSYCIHELQSSSLPLTVATAEVKTMVSKRDWYSLVYVSLLTLVGRRYSELSFALGGYNDVRHDGEQSNWKPDMKAVRATIDFVLATKRLDYVPLGTAQSSQASVGVV